MPEGAAIWAPLVSLATDVEFALAVRAVIKPNQDIEKGKGGVFVPR
jgi:hypothetical protein